MMSTILSIFPTKLGWFGVAGREGRVSGLCFGHESAAEVQFRMSATHPDADETGDWHPLLRERLQAYAEGEADDFRDVEVDSDHLTPFQQRVVRRLRKVGYGETVSYGELADLVGAPRSARAVGRVMATNRVPIILPCHRVLAAGGALGGFSAPQGVSMKLRLLQLEGAAGFADRPWERNFDLALAACSG